MTGVERETLTMALDFLKEWRTDDKEWKDKADKRLAALEKRATTDDAVAVITSAAQQAAKTDRKWRVGIIVTAIIGTLGLVIQLVNAAKSAGLL